jgi:hypothetical protein
MLDLETTQWTWMGGSGTTYVAPVAGEQGKFAEDNSPGTRYNCAYWTDQQGNLWLFGGASTLVNNQLWKYDTTQKSWAWMGGTDNQYAGSIIGPSGESSDRYIPGPRNSMATWTTSDGTAWIFSGLGSGEIGGYYSALNDMWRFTPTQNTNAVDWQKARLFD